MVIARHIEHLSKLSLIHREQRVDECERVARITGHPLRRKSAAVKVVRRFSVVSAIALIHAKPHHGGGIVRLPQPTTE